MKQGSRQSSNIEDHRVTPRDMSMGMDTTLKTQAAPKGNRPRYDAAIANLRSGLYAQKLNGLNREMDKLKGKIQ